MPPNLINGIANVDPYNMVGCTAHTIKGYNVISGDYEFMGE